MIKEKQLTIERIITKADIKSNTNKKKYFFYNFLKVFSIQNKKKIFLL
jgi:hypothetical protein